MRIYCISDTHFGHEKMIELCGRPEGFESTILSNLRKIPSTAILIHLGDFCIGEDERWHNEFMEATQHLRRTILVRGNHDHKSDNWYLKRGWDFVCNELITRYFKKHILFSHRPSPIAGYVDINIHGHLHNTGHHEQGECGNHHLLAIENTDYKPVSLEVILRG